MRTATAALAGREHLQVALSVVDDKNPLLAFGEDGLLLAPGLPIPARPTWLLFPGESNEPAIDGEATILSESPLPPGWAGWSLQQRDLTHATNITVAGSHRVVRSQAAAHIEVGEPVRGVRTSNGHLVVTTIPTIKLPEHLSDANWEVALLTGSGEPVARWSVADQSGDPNSVWDEIARPIVGTFTVRVRGPWGRGATRTVTIVENLDVRFTPSWRRFAPGGLQPGMARLSVANGMEATRTSIEFCEREREAFVRVGAHREFRTLVITPPHMTVAYQSADVTSSPSVRPLGLFREDIAAHPGTLVLDVGTAADPTLYTIASGKPIQSITPSAGRAGIYRFDLSKLVDTLAGHPLVNLTLSADGALTVATVRPRRLFREATLTDGCLEFADCVAVEGLTAFAYPARAPWREPAVMPVVEGQVKLPAWLNEAGPVRVLVRIEDPWAPLPVAEWPDRRQSTLVGCDGWVIDDDDEGTALSAFLAGVRDFPSEIADFTRLWTVRGLLPELGLGPRIKDVADAIDAALHENPRPALLALSASSAPSQTIPALVISAGLAWANLEAAHDDAAPPWSVRSALPATLLSAADSQWSDEEVDAAVTVCGDVVSELLRGKDRFATLGRFDAGADLFDREPTMREEFVRQAGLIPRGLLSGD